ncbi:MAG: elongation factor P [Erythrobacter sp.]|nr:elongation factor P [Erythrobacter sp.]
MVRILPVIAALSAAAFPVAAEATFRDIGVMPKGRYQCALPGDAAARPYVPVPELSFRISSASRYTHISGRGIYLLEGDTLLFTRGPLKDMRLRRMQGGLLQQVKSDGTLGRVRCHRASR